MDLLKGNSNPEISEKNSPQTWVARKFQKLLQKMENSFDEIYISLSIESLQVITPKYINKKHYKRHQKFQALALQIITDST